jgi:putative nucleotidyltransferase with HDIG domain
VVSENNPAGRPILTLDDLARPLTRRPERIHALTQAELAIAFSQGLDLAEGKHLGHAQRVCYIAALIAEELGLEPQQRNAVFFAALLHDIGVPLAASEICRIAGVDEETIFGPSPLKAPEELKGALSFADLSTVVEAVHQHAVVGAATVRNLDLPEDVAAAVRAHHERWDGFGFPDALSRDAAPIEARIVAAADVAESLIAGEPSSLAARRRLAPAIAPYAGAALDPNVVARLLDLGKSDEFWLGLYAEDMPEMLHALRPATEARRSRKRVMRFAEVFADLADVKAAHAIGHSRRTADNAGRLAEAYGLDAGHTEMVRIAALLHDIGLLGVPARVMTKPDILSITEMQLMRQHPAHSETVLGALNGFEEIAVWAARHHERPDGKGYPEMLAGEDLPVESRILAVADVYSALTSERAYRGAVQRKDAKDILLGAGGTQLDAELVRLFVTLI